MAVHSIKNPGSLCQYILGISYLETYPSGGLRRAFPSQTKTPVQFPDRAELCSYRNGWYSVHVRELTWLEHIWVHDGRQHQSRSLLKSGESVAVWPSRKREILCENFKILSRYHRPDHLSFVLSAQIYRQPYSVRLRWWWCLSRGPLDEWMVMKPSWKQDEYVSTQSLVGETNSLDIMKVFEYRSIPTYLFESMYICIICICTMCIRWLFVGGLNILAE